MKFDDTSCYLPVYLPSFSPIYLPTHLPIYQPTNQQGGHVDAARALIKDLRADVNKRNRWGTTPLAEAVRLGHDEIAVILRDHGACLFLEIDSQQVSLSTYLSTFLPTYLPTMEPVCSWKIDSQQVSLHTYLPMQEATDDEVRSVLTHLSTYLTFYLPTSLCPLYFPTNLPAL